MLQPMCVFSYLNFKNISLDAAFMHQFITLLTQSISGCQSLFILFTLSLKLQLSIYMYIKVGQILYSFQDFSSHSCYSFSASSHSALSFKTSCLTEQQAHINQWEFIVGQVKAGFIQLMFSTKVSILRTETECLC